MGKMWHIGRARDEVQPKISRHETLLPTTETKIIHFCHF